MSKRFEPTSALENAIHRGDLGGVTKLLDALDDAGRAAQRASVSRCARWIAKARFSFGDDTFAGWGKAVDEAQRSAITAAAVACGCAPEVAPIYSRVEELIDLGRKYGAAALEGLSDAMLERDWHIFDVQRLIEAGVMTRPSTERYYVAAMNLASRNHGDQRDIHQRLAADPGLREVLLRMLEVEGNSNTSLANVDKYTVKNRASWITNFLELLERGLYTRAQLAEKCLAALERGWIQYRSGWFSDFHARMAPTPEEMRPHAVRYLGLLGSRIPPTVTFALDVAKQLDKAGMTEAAALLDALRPVFSSSVKGQVEKAMKLADALVKRDA
jgi:hypothetical protein